MLVGRRPLATLALSGTLATLAALAPAQAFGQVALQPPFESSYSLADIGAPPGVPANFGGLTLKAGTRDRLLIGGEANAASGALYEIGVTRDALGHINGFNGMAARFADAANNDGGVTYGPGGVLFLARWPVNDLGQTKPGSSITDKIIDLDPLGVASSVGALQFAPPGQPGAGSLKLASYNTGQWYDADVTPDGTGTYNLLNVTNVPGSTLTGRGPEGIVYVTPGSTQFAGSNMLVSEYSAGQVGAYRVDANGDPVVATRRTFISGLTGAEGAFIDPVTGDFLFSTFGGGGRVIVVRGFASPTPVPNPVLGKNVNVQTLSGVVRIGVRTAAAGSGRARASQKGLTFVPLREARQIPVGSFLDTRKGSVRVQSARNRRGTRQNGDFSRGLFQVLQSRQRKAKGLTELRLKGSSFASCKTPRRGRRAQASASRRIRRLSSNTRGRFRTRGRHSAATVRGTKWTVTDRCDGTLTTVQRGKVTVRDFRRKKNITVKAGKSYLARARR